MTAAQGTQAARYEHSGDEIRWHRQDASYRIVVDGDGLALRIWRLLPEGARLVYARPTRPVAALVTLVGEALVARIPEAVRRCPLDEPAAGLLLAYDAEALPGCLPPLLVPVLESERPPWLGRGGASARAWSLGELRLFGDDRLALDDATFLADAAELTTLLAAGGGAVAARQLLVDAARALNCLDWGSIVRTSRDFLVVPLDLEMADLDENLAAVRQASPGPPPVPIRP